MLTASASTVSREPLHGVRQIIRFNWHLYVVAAMLLTLAPMTIQAAAFVWIAGSLIASWLVYDRSALMTASWIPRAVGFTPRVWLNIHAGFDELTPALQAVLPATDGRSLDIFDAREMTEPSIARARAGAARAEHADFRKLPVATGEVEAVFLLLSAHELRSHAARCALMSEARRVLAAEGRVIVAEHLRDLANFAAFGPGCLHFHSRRTWTRCFADAGLTVHEEFSITPFVRVFVLRRTS